MTHWRVRIDCFRKGVAHPMIRRFIVEALDSTAAVEAARKHAEATAIVGPVWTAFDMRECARVTFPLEIGA